MLSAKGDDGNAIKYYERAVKEGYAAQLPQNDPIGFADFITDYAEALSAIGQSALAGEQREMAQTLRQNNPGKESKTDLVPYGQQCTNPEHSDNRSNKSPQPTQ